jgi:hypothetical protein
MEGYFALNPLPRSGTVPRRLCLLGRGAYRAAGIEQEGLNDLPSKVSSDKWENNRRRGYTCEK